MKDPQLVVTRPTTSNLVTPIDRDKNLSNNDSRDVNNNSSSKEAKKRVSIITNTNASAQPSQVIDDMYDSHLKEYSNENQNFNQVYNREKRGSDQQGLMDLDQKFDPRNSQGIDLGNHGKSGNTCCLYCHKRLIDLVLLFAILVLFIITFVGYLVILNISENTSDNANDKEDSYEFAGFVPMPNLNKTIEGAPITTNNGTILTTRDFFMQCKYQDGADRFMFSCMQLDEHFVLKDNEL